MLFIKQFGLNMKENQVVIREYFNLEIDCMTLIMYIQVVAYKKML